MSYVPINNLSLKYLSFAYPQSYGAVTIIPVIREKQSSSLRVSRAVFKQSTAVVALPDGHYTSFIPHGFLIHDNDERATARFANQTELLNKRAAHSNKGHSLHTKLIKRIGNNAVRILPMHQAMESLLTLAFSPPKTLHRELRADTFRFGMEFNCEYSYPSDCVRGFAEALKIFEIHDGQVGTIVLVNGKLASCFIVPHANDYKELHDSVLLDHFGELIVDYSHCDYADIDPPLQIDKDKVSSLSDLETALNTAKAQQESMLQEVIKELFETTTYHKKHYKLGASTLSSFHTELSSSENQHIGEAILASGEIQFLKSYALDQRQAEKARILKTLETHDWMISDCTNALGLPKDQWVSMLRRHGLADFYKPEYLHPS